MELQSAIASSETYAKLPNLAIGFHGCSERASNNVACKGIPLKYGRNDCDYLGSSIYF